MAARYIRIILPLCALVAVPRAAPADQAMTRVTVRIYETAGLGPELKAVALAVAGTTIASTSADVWWKHCDTRGQSSACDGPPTGEFVVRIVRSTTELHGKHLPLGDALVDTSSGAAVFATIYFDRVARVAQAANIQAATLLGYAVAHELGHLLLASIGHNTVGLMRPIWRDEELRSRRTVDWVFTNEEIAAIRRRLPVGAPSYPENPIQRPPQPTVDQRARDVIATTRLRIGEK
jgi:hypothetical protein